MEGQGSSRRHPGCSGPVLEGGVVKVGWRAHRQDPTDRGSQWPYLPPCFPLPRHLCIEEVDIWSWAWDAEKKSSTI